MRRIIMALFAMSTGTALLVGLKSQQLAVPLGLVTVEPLDVAGGGDDPVVGDGPEPTDSPGSTVGVEATTGATTGAPTTATPAATITTSAAAPPPTTGTPGVSGTFAGTAVAVKTAQTPNTKSRSCGDCHAYSMSVTITVVDGRITNASVSYSTDPGDSKRYADKAKNALSPKILTAQTWRLGNVSGATYSANAFELSVKDAMAKAGLPT